MSEYAEIIIDLITDAVDKSYHYAIPREIRDEVYPGSVVSVPFGRRRCRGYVMRLLKVTDVEPDQIKSIVAVESKEPVLNREQLSLIPWLAMRCVCRRIEALHAILPVSLRRGQIPSRRAAFFLAPDSEKADLKRAPVQKQALDVLKSRGYIVKGEMSRLGVSPAALQALERKGLVLRGTAPVQNEETASVEPAPPLNLQGQQKGCYQEILAALQKKIAQKILLHGITASGKTEVYLQAIAHCLSRGEGALVLVPEIALTPQMIEFFQQRFPGRITALHSRLTPAEKEQHWMKIREGEAAVVLGARSAVFAPLEKIGLIVLDEEHEHTYKQEESPRYHTREVAWRRARYHKAVLLLGSATPSLESYYETGIGKSKLLQMDSRVTEGRLPPVSIIDMRKEMKEGHRSIFSRILLEELLGVLDRGEQALLFLNRRGFASFVLCRECGYVVRCPSCAVSLTLHADSNRMICHYCSYQAPVPGVCPSCLGVHIKYFGAGTQRVEDEIKKVFPGISVIRMDSDTTSRRGSHQRLYRQFREGEAKILIGTQMIAKGFNFPNVTLVGVVTADTAINLPDFRAAERTFQLLTQVAGRAGRGPRGGKVILQTYHPAHYSITAAADHDYKKFFQEELERRRQLCYPPFSDMVRFLVTGEDEEAVWEGINHLTGALEPFNGKGDIMGPAPAPLFRLKTFYRAHTILKGERLHTLAPALRDVARSFRARKTARPVRLLVDYNPQVVL